MSIFGGPERGGGGAPNRDAMGNVIVQRGDRPDTSYSAAFGGPTNSYVQAPVIQPNGNQLLFPAITTAPLVQTHMDGQSNTKAVIVPSTQSLIPPPSTLLTSSYAGLPGTGASLFPGGAFASGPAPVGVMQPSIHRSQHLRGSGSLIGSNENGNEDFEKMKKARLRNDLLNQMNDNASRRLEERRIKGWQDEYDDERIFLDNAEQRRRYDHEEWKRK